MQSRLFARNWTLPARSDNLCLTTNRYERNNQLWGCDTCAGKPYRDMGGRYMAGCLLCGVAMALCRRRRSNSSLYDLCLCGGGNGHLGYTSKRTTEIIRVMMQNLVFNDKSI